MTGKFQVISERVNAFESKKRGRVEQKILALLDQAVRWTSESSEVDHNKDRENTEHTENRRQIAAGEHSQV